MQFGLRNPLHIYFHVGLVDNVRQSSAPIPLPAQDYDTDNVRHLTLTILPGQWFRKCLLMLDNVRQFNPIPPCL